MSTRPHVSVLISVYNDGPYLARAVDSILNQTFADFELILVDDGSSDDTPEVIASFDDPRIVAVQHENRGLVPSLNRGLEMARGRYLARLDGDDTSRPDRLARQLDFLETDPNRVVVGSWATVHGLDGTYLDEIRPPTDDVELRWQLLWRIIYPHSALCVRTDVLREVGGWDESFWREYPHASDYDLVVRLSQVGELAAVPEPLLKWQYDTEDGISVKHRDEQKITNQAIGRRQLEDLIGRSLSPDLTKAAWHMANEPKRLEPSDTKPATDLILEAVRCFHDRYPGGLARQTTDDWLAATAEQLLSDARKDRTHQVAALQAASRLSPSVKTYRAAAKAAVKAVVGPRVTQRLIGPR